MTPYATYYRGLVLIVDSTSISRLALFFILQRKSKGGEVSRVKSGVLPMGLDSCTLPRKVMLQYTEDIVDVRKGAQGSPTFEEQYEASKRQVTKLAKDFDWSIQVFEICIITTNFVVGCAHERWFLFSVHRQHACCFGPGSESISIRNTPYCSSYDTMRSCVAAGYRACLRSLTLRLPIFIAYARPLSYVAGTRRRGDALCQRQHLLQAKRKRYPVVGRADGLRFTRGSA